MDDDIQLPPLPNDTIPGMREWIDDVRRAAVLADRERQAEKAKPAKPTVHSATVWLRLGTVWLNDSFRPAEGKQLDLRWTSDGRAWIDSGRNRELAARMRAAAGRGFTSPTYTDLLDAADALDGVVR